MDSEKLKQYLEYLSDKHEEYNLATNKRQKEAIRDRVLFYGDNMDDEIYAYLNNDAANGLFRRSFFEGDLEKSIRLLEEAIEDED